MVRITNVKMKLGYTEKDLLGKISKKIQVPVEKITYISIVKKSVDARDKNNIVFILTVDLAFDPSVDIEKFIRFRDVSTPKIVKYTIPRAKGVEDDYKRPVIVGSGPAGLFCGYVLAKAGLRPIIIEQGKDVDSRAQDIENFIKTGELNPFSNVQFGEGGAGTFSDGKLNSSNKDIRQKFVLDTFISNGAPEEIGYLAKPHVGTDNLVKVIKSMRGEIEKFGGEIRFENKFVGFEEVEGKVVSVEVEFRDRTYTLQSDYLILAIGHSARDTFKLLDDKKIRLEAKPFAVGVRIEHSREFINKTQYGEFFDNKQLGTADYKMVTDLSNGRKAYTFCMCPGGVVMPATSEVGQVTTNGMSYFSRKEDNSNSAILISIQPSDYKIGEGSPLDGVEFQRNLERKAFELGGGNYYAPYQLVEDFLNDVPTESYRSVVPSYKPGVKPSDLRECLDPFLVESLKEALLLMNKKIRGFAGNDAIITAVESRSSSPVWIRRDENLFTNIKGIVPCGEGAGYAGGIMSAAVDGIKCAEKIIDGYLKK